MSALSGAAKRSEELSNANTLPMSVTFVVFWSDIERILFDGGFNLFIQDCSYSKCAQESSRTF